MCLIIVKPADVEFDEKFLRGVYKKNKDGVGAMYAKDSVLYYAKAVPKNFEDVKAFWKAHVEGKECVVHFRMQTHGGIDTVNAHPYEVLRGDYPLFLMHNGMLHTDNLEDPTKSDTYLYVRNYLRPMLEHNPEWFLTPEFEELIASHIGNDNKFVFLDAFGNQVIVNEEAFVKYNGALLSNTYAWDTTGTEFEPKWKGGYGLGKYYGGYSDEGDDWASCYRIPRDYRKNETDGEADAGEAGVSSQPDIVDASIFAAEMFNTLATQGLNEAYTTLRHEELENYYLRMGDEDALMVLQMVEEGSFTDEELLDEIRCTGGGQP